MFEESKYRLNKKNGSSIPVLKASIGSEREENSQNNYLDLDQQSEENQISESIETSSIELDDSPQNTGENEIS